MTDIPSEAIQRIQQQIEIIKKYSGLIDESQGLIANALTQLIVFDSLNAINQNLISIQAMISSKPADQPLFVLP